MQIKLFFLAIQIVLMMETAIAGKDNQKNDDSAIEQRETTKSVDYDYEIEKALEKLSKDVELLDSTSGKSSSLSLFKEKPEMAVQFAKRQAAEGKLQISERYELLRILLSSCPEKENSKIVIYVIALLSVGLSIISKLTKNSGHDFYYSYSEFKRERLSKKLFLTAAVVANSVLIRQIAKKTREKEEPAIKKIISEIERYETLFPASEFSKLIVLKQLFSKKKNPKTDKIVAQKMEAALMEE